MTGLDPATFADLADAVRAAPTVVALGAETHAGVGGAVDAAAEVRAGAGILDFQPADMTVALLAGTTCADLDRALAERGQECPLDPDDATATVGGTLAAGLSGLRRLGVGPLRDTLLEVVLVLADGRIVRGGGPTVKNVTGYDIPRLVVGSLGTLGVIARVTLRTRPRPRASQWFASDRPAAALHALSAPAAVVATPAGTRVWLEGHPDDVAAAAASFGLTPTHPVVVPSGPHRGRVSVAPGHLDDLLAGLGPVGGIDWLGEHGVGTVRIAARAPEPLAAVRTLAHEHGGWLLREAGAPALDPFGVEIPAADLQRRIRAALDPTGKLAPGRVSATEPTPVTR